MGVDLLKFLRDPNNRWRLATYALLILATILSAFDQPFIAVLTLIATVIGFSVDVSHSRATQWPKLTARERDIVADSLRGSFAKVNIWHHSTTEVQQFANTIRDVFKAAGSETDLKAGFTAPAEGVVVRSPHLSDVKLVQSAFRLVGLEFETRVERTDEGGTLFISINDSPGRIWTRRKRGIATA